MTPPDTRPRPDTNWLQRLRGLRRGAVVAATVVVTAIVASIAFAVVSGDPPETGEPPASSQPSPSSASPTSRPSATPSVTPAQTPSPTKPLIVASTAEFSLLPAEQPAEYAPTIQCSGSIGLSDPVALVTLQTQVDLPYREFVLRNYADLVNPRTVCTFRDADAWSTELIDSRHVVLAGPDGTYAVVYLPEVEYHWFRLPDQGYARLVAVSPQLDEVAWLHTVSQTTPGAERTLRLTTAAGDQTVATLPPEMGGRCGTGEDSSWGAYTYSDDHLYVLDQLMPSVNTLVVLRGAEQVFSLVPPGGGWIGNGYPAWPLWSPMSDALFYRHGIDVWRWTPTAGAEIYLSGVMWYFPSISPDGRNLVYHVPRGDGVHDVFLVDLVEGGEPRQIGAARSRPVFLNNSQLWYVADGPDGGCVTDRIPRELIYDLRDASEAPSVIHNVWAVWPATSSLP